ncbi:class II aldolase/adducin domain-containing protein [Abortiporus biennis]|nr:class II aldolase/adducin domain-containing protein [Abortiporus biennis]
MTVSTITTTQKASLKVKGSDDAGFKTALRGGFPKPPRFEDKLEEREYQKFRLAQAFRIFGNLGFEEGVAGHITVRDCIRPDCFWVNPMGKAFSTIQPEDLILLDHDGKVQKEESSSVYTVTNTAAFMIHSAIHKSRPDVICAAHTHSFYGKTFSTLSKPLDALTQDSCAYYNDHVVYKTFNGVVLAEDEGIRIAELLGDKKAAILQNHGLLVAANSIEATVHFYVAMERACQSQLLAEAAGYASGTPPISIHHEEAVSTYKTIGSMYSGWFNGLPLFQTLQMQEGKKFEFSDSVKGVTPLL